MTKKYPYQNRSLNNIYGEKWKDVPEYEGLYQVSNFGRVKSFPRYIEFLIPGRHVVSYWKPEKILSQGIGKRYNSISGEYIYRITVTFCVEQKMKTIGVSHLVWEGFGNNSHYRKNKLYILHKDGDGRNNQIKNLKTGSQSEAGKEAYKRGRFIKLVNYLNEDVFVKRGLGRRKPVTQYDFKGNRVEIFNSIKEAEQATGIFHSNICLATKGKKRQMGGFIWRYGKGRKKISTSSFEKDVRLSKYLSAKTVTQYDLLGKRIKIYPSIREASQAIGSHQGVISNAISGVNQTAKGFIWRPGKGENKIDTSFYRKRKKRVAEIFAKRVAQFSLQGKKLKTYSSIKDAAAAIGCCTETISAAARKNKKAKGYIWKFID
jgi:hypothetical protein